MSASNKRSLIFIIVFLLLTNIGVLFYFLWDKKPGHKAQPKDPVGGLAPSLREIGFDTLQIAGYKKMKDEQWKKFKPMLDDVKKAKDSLYRLVGSETVTDSTISSLTTLIGERQKAVDQQAFNHFKRVRTLCRPDQLAKYDSVILHTLRKMNKIPRGDQGKKDKEKSKN